MNIKLVSIDLAKTVFQICAIDSFGKVVMNKKVTRVKLLNEVLKLKPQQVVMEACYSSNYWGRLFQSQSMASLWQSPKAL
jgi:transposase